MLIKKAARIASSEITDEKHWKQRRQFLKSFALVAGGVLSPSILLADEAEKLPAAMPHIKHTDYGKGLKTTAYKDIRAYNNFYEFGTRKEDPARYAQDFITRPWTIKVSGECEAAGEIGMEDILSQITQQERIYRFRCVEGWAMVVPWNGFSLSELLKRFKPTSKAKYVAFETLYDPKQMPGQKRRVLDWPYREGLRIDEAMHPLTMMVTGIYGRLLPNQNGAPLRLIIPWKYGFKSIKSIVSIQFTETQPVATWNQQVAKEYGFYANVNPQVDHPRWSQAYHRNIGEGIFSRKQKTEMFNGYADEVAHLYSGMDLKKYF